MISDESVNDNVYSYDKKSLGNSLSNIDDILVDTNLSIDLENKFPSSHFKSYQNTDTTGHTNKSLISRIKYPKKRMIAVKYKKTLKFKLKKLLLNSRYLYTLIIKKMLPKTEKKILSFYFRKFISLALSKNSSDEGYSQLKTEQSITENK